MASGKMKLFAAVLLLFILAAVVLPAVEAQLATAQANSNADANEAPKFLKKAAPRGGKKPRSAITAREDPVCAVELLRLETPSGKIFTYPEVVVISKEDLKAAKLHVKAGCNVHKFTYDFYSANVEADHFWIKAYPENLNTVVRAPYKLANEEFYAVPDPKIFDESMREYGIADGTYNLKFEVCALATGCSGHWHDSPLWPITIGRETVAESKPYFSKFIQPPAAKSFSETDTKTAEIVFEKAFTLEASKVNIGKPVYLRIGNCPANEAEAGSGDELLRKVESPNVTSASLAFDFAASSWTYTRPLYLCQYAGGSVYSDSITLTAKTTGELCAATGNLVYCLGLIDKRLVTNIFGVESTVKKADVVTVRVGGAVIEPQPAQPAEAPQPAGVCGDGELTPNEECDGGNLNNKQCTDLYPPGITTAKYSGGTLSCQSNCLFDKSKCTRT